MLSAFMNAVSLHKDFKGTCNGVPWVYSTSSSSSLSLSRTKQDQRLRQTGTGATTSAVGVICAGCKGFTSKDMCADVTNSVVIGSKTPCYVNGNIVKSAGSIGIHQKPVVAKTVPELVNMTATAGRTNATAKVTLIGYAPGGQVYCAAVPTTSRQQQNAVKTFSQLKASPSTSSVTFTLSNSSSFFSYSLVMTGLTPSLKYDVMCALQDSLGNTGPFQMVIDSLVTVNTTCCRSISFTNAPSSVYGDATKYFGGNTLVPVSTTAYVFSYSLDIPPDVSITISPVFSNGATALKATPSSQVFSSSMVDSQLTGSFILNGLPGLYSMRLAVSGPSAPTYYSLSSAVQVNVLSSSVPPLPPVLLKATFSESGAKLFVYFDSATDGAQSVTEIASANSAWPCKLLLNFKGVENAVCDWINSTVVQIQLTANDNILAVGTLVMLLPSRVKAACIQDCSSTGNYAFSAAATVKAMAPANPVSPIVVLTIPSTISKCNNLTVDPTSSSGSGGRDWLQVKWVVTSGIFITFALR